jgi:hypothetical protein
VLPENVSVSGNLLIFFTLIKIFLFYSGCSGSSSSSSSSGGGGGGGGMQWY